jgi:hypothetical protein
MSDPNDNANRAPETEESVAAPETKPEGDQAPAPEISEEVNEETLSEDASDDESSDAE